LVVLVCVALSFQQDCPIGSGFLNATHPIDYYTCTYPQEQNALFSKLELHREGPSTEAMTANFILSSLNTSEIIYDRELTVPSSGNGIILSQYTSPCSLQKLNANSLLGIKIVLKVTPTAVLDWTIKSSYVPTLINVGERFETASSSDTTVFYSFVLPDLNTLAYNLSLNFGENSPFFTLSLSYGFNCPEDEDNKNVINLIVVNTSTVTFPNAGGGKWWIKLDRIQTRKTNITVSAIPSFVGTCNKETGWCEEPTPTPSSSPQPSEWYDRPVKTLVPFLVGIILGIIVLVLGVALVAVWIRGKNSNPAEHEKLIK